MPRARSYNGRRRGMGRIGSPAQLLDSRLALRVEPGRITPASRIINGTARYTDPLKSGTPRQLQPKYGLTFASGEYAAAGSPVIPANTDFTLSMWFTSTSTASRQWLFSQYANGASGRLLCELHSNNSVQTANYFRVFLDPFGSWDNAVTIPTSGWHHLAFKRSGDVFTARLDFADGTSWEDSFTHASASIYQGNFWLNAGPTVTAFPLVGSMDGIRVFPSALSASDIAALAAMKPGSTSGVTVSAVPLIHYKCEDPVTSATVKNSGSLGASANATITGTVANVRGTVSPVFCWANEVGYTEGTGSNGGAVGELIPRDESNTTKDIAGNDLQYVGQCPRDMVLTSSAVVGNGTSEYVYVPGFSSANIQVDELDLTCYVSSADTTAGQAIVAFGNDADNNATLKLEKATTTAGKIRVFMKASNAATILSVESSATVFDGSAHKVRLTLDGLGGYALYVDNELDSSGTYTPANTTAVDTLTYLAWTRNALAVVTHAAATIWDVDLIHEGTRFCTHPLTEPSGDIAFDISGDGNDGKLTGTIATMRGGTQDKSDVLVKSGYSVGRWYDGANDGWTKATRLTTGSQSSLSVHAFGVTASASGMIASENSDQPNRGWYFWIDALGNLELVTSVDGTATESLTSSATFDDGKLHSFAFTTNGTTGVLYVDGQPVASTGAVAASINDNTTAFYIGRAGGGSYWSGVMSQLLVHSGVAWSADTVAAIRAAGKPSEIQAIVSGLGGTAWYFPYGDGSYEALQSLPALTHNGASEQRIIPAGAAGIQPTHGPGLLAPGQSLDLYCGQDDAPICQLLAGDLADGIYDFGDGDEADALYKRGDANGEEIAVITPAATGAEQTVLNAWST